MVLLIGVTQRRRWRLRSMKGLPRWELTLRTINLGVLPTLRLVNTSLRNMGPLHEGPAKRRINGRNWQLLRLKYIDVSNGGGSVGEKVVKGTVSLTTEETALW